MDRETKQIIGMIGCVVVILVVAMISMSGTSRAYEPDTSMVPEEPEVELPQEQPEEVEPEPEAFHPEAFNGLLIGFDKSLGLTDVIMVGHFDPELNEFKIISVPRDLLIDFREEPFKTMKEEDPNNKIVYCKLTEVYGRLGQTPEALQTVREIIGKVVGLDMDYMATIDTAGFKDVVDAVGGVDFYVPRRMYHRDDAQGLYINLHKGQQLLDGDHAEQLVRFRGYNKGDLERIETQQAFIAALFEQVSGSITEFSQMSKLINIFYNIFEADFGLGFAMDYAHYFFEMDRSNLLNQENMMTIPTGFLDLYHKNKDGEDVRVSYLEWDMDETHEAVQELLERGHNQTAVDEDAEPSDEESSTNSTEEKSES